MSEHVTIERRFNGPPDFGHGGYSCGLVAERIEAPIAAVSLRAPPPLERPLDVERDGDGTLRLLDGDQLVAEGAPAELDLDVPDPVEPGDAEGLSPDNAWLDEHPFPTCFGCGPKRDPADALRVLVGPVPGRDVLAAPWTPHPSLADERGHVTPLFAWAALDCPTGFAAIDRESGAAVLARLTADPGRAPVVAGEPHVVTSWLIDRDGRKSRGGAAIHTAEAELCALSEGLWIQLRDPAAVGARV